MHSTKPSSIILDYSCKLPQQLRACRACCSLLCRLRLRSSCRAPTSNQRHGTSVPWVAPCGPLTWTVARLESSVLGFIYYISKWSEWSQRIPVFKCKYFLKNPLKITGGLRPVVSGKCSQQGSALCMYVNMISVDCKLCDICYASERASFFSGKKWSPRYWWDC